MEHFHFSIVYFFRLLAPYFVGKPILGSKLKTPSSFQAPVNQSNQFRSFSKLNTSLHVNYR